MTSRTYVGELLVIAVVVVVGLSDATAEIEPLSSLSVGSQRRPSPATSGVQFIVAGENSDNIVRFDSSTGESTVVAKLAAGSRPWSMAVNQAGEIFVGLRGNKKNIVRLVPGPTGDADGPLVAVDLTGTIGRFGPGLMAFDGRGLLNVAGDTHRVVQRYDVKTGELVESMRLRAANLVGLTLAGDSVFAAEYFQKTILRFDLTADPPRGEKFIYKSGHLDRAHGMTVGHNRNLFVSNLKNSLVQEFNGDTGKFVKTFLDVRTIGGGNVKDLHFEPQLDHYFLSTGSVVYELSSDAALLAKHQSNALSGAVAIAVIPTAGQSAEILRLRVYQGSPIAGAAGTNKLVSDGIITVDKPFEFKGEYSLVASGVVSRDESGKLHFKGKVSHNAGLVTFDSPAKLGEGIPPSGGGGSSFIIPYFVQLERPQ